MATISACAVGSLLEVTSFQPSEMILLFRTITAPNGPPLFARIFSSASVTARCMNACSVMTIFDPSITIGHHASHRGIRLYVLALWLFERFDLSLAAASAFFFWSNVLTAFSYPVAARLGKRFGLVNTMVFTHIPSSLCLILAAFSPSLTIVLALLLVRSALSQMDVPTRTSYVMAVVTPAERTAAASVTAVPRSLASSISPALSGALLSTSFAGLPLVVCGVLKIVYDLSLLFSFRHIKPPEEKEAPQ